MVPVVLIDVGVEGTRVDDQRDRRVSRRRISSIRRAVSWRPLRPVFAAMRRRRPAPRASAFAERDVLERRFTASDPGSPFPLASLHIASSRAMPVVGSSKIGNREAALAPRLSERGLQSLLALLHWERGLKVEGWLAHASRIGVNDASLEHWS